MKKLYDVYEETLSFGGAILESQIIFSGTREECRDFIDKYCKPHTGAYCNFIYTIWEQIPD